MISHTRSIIAVGVLAALSTLTTPAATLYVSLDSPGPSPPYTSWATAATNIQDAVDAAVVADVIVVTNGTYATGGRAVVGTMTNRVALYKPVTVRSVNGPQFTIIRGYQVPGTINGDGAIRCVYLTNGASLSGFTLTNGSAGSGDGGGLYCQSATAVVSNCVMVGNSAHVGGGTFGGTLYNCTLTSNSASVLGGGAGNSTLNNCTLTGNSANEGGGVYGGTLNNCTLTGNSADEAGGGAYHGTLNNCTLTDNSAGLQGGGAYCGTLNNCIVYFNTAPGAANYCGSTLSYCCTTPMPVGGTGNITLDPQLASASHLSATSPCRGAGSAAYSSGNDIDGEPWAAPPSIGCDEYHAGAVTGPLGVRVAAAYTNVVPRCEVSLTALIEGRTTTSEWDLGDGIAATNRPYATHAWAALGDYAVVLRAYNESYPGGVSATVTVHVVEQRVHYVAVDSANPLPPYTSWATAATNIQDAVNTASVAGSLVLVSNGTYATGGRAVSRYVTNRVAVTKPLTLWSVNGPGLTVIDGTGSVRCVYLANGASLSGFTLTNGETDHAGGLWCESATAVVSNCVLTGNSAGGSGGGAYGGTFYKCRLTGNSAAWGGGASYSTLNNCVLTGNLASFSGGGAEV